MDEISSSDMFSFPLSQVLAIAHVCMVLTMKLPKVNSLMVILALQMPSKVLKQLLAISSFRGREMEIKSSISFLLLLKRKVGTNERFFLELKELLSSCKCQDLLTMVTKFNEENPGWLSENWLPFRARISIPECIFAGEPQKNQISMCFRKVLYEISEVIGSEDLEIMIGVSPIPESRKEELNLGMSFLQQ